MELLNLEKVAQKFLKQEKLAQQFSSAIVACLLAREIISSLLYTKPLPHRPPPRMKRSTAFKRLSFCVGLYYAKLISITSLRAHGLIGFDLTVKLTFKSREQIMTHNL